MITLMFTHLQLGLLLAKIGWVDIVGLLLFLWGLLAGAKRGLEVELPKFLDISAATILALRYYRVMGTMLHEKLAAPQYPAELLSFVVITLTCVVSFRLFFRILGMIVSLKFMDIISRAGGAVVGAVRYVLTFSLVSYFLLQIPLNFFANSYTFDRSWSGPFFAQTSEKYYRLVTYYMPFRLEIPGQIRSS